MKVLLPCTGAPVGNRPSCAAFDWSLGAAFAGRRARRTATGTTATHTRTYPHHATGPAPPCTQTFCFAIGSRWPDPRQCRQQAGCRFTFQHELPAGRRAKPENDSYARVNWCGAEEAVVKMLPPCTGAPVGKPPSCAARSRLRVYALDWSRGAVFADRLARRTERPGRLLLTRAHTHTVPRTQTFCFAVGSR